MKKPILAVISEDETNHRVFSRPPLSEACLWEVSIHLCRMKKGQIPGASEIIQRSVRPGASDVTALTHVSADDRLTILVVLERAPEAETGHHVVRLLGAKRTPDLRPLGPQVLEVTEHVRVLEVLKYPSKQLVHAPLPLVSASRPLTYVEAVRPKPGGTRPSKGHQEDTKTGVTINQNKLGTYSWEYYIS